MDKEVIEAMKKLASFMTTLVRDALVQIYQCSGKTHEEWSADIEVNQGRCRELLAEKGKEILKTIKEKDEASAKLTLATICIEVAMTIAKEREIIPQNARSMYVNKPELN